MSARYSIPFGRVAEHVPEHPERTAFSMGRSWDSDVSFRVWPSRGAMLTSIHMQGKRAPRQDDWRDWQASRWHKPVVAK